MTLAMLYLRLGSGHDMTISQPMLSLPSHEIQLIKTERLFGKLKADLFIFYQQRALKTFSQTGTDKQQQDFKNFDLQSKFSTTAWPTAPQPGRGECLEASSKCSCFGRDFISQLISRIPVKTKKLDVKQVYFKYISYISFHCTA